MAEDAVKDAEVEAAVEGVNNDKVKAVVLVVHNSLDKKKEAPQLCQLVDHQKNRRNNWEHRWNNFLKRGKHRRRELRLLENMAKENEANKQRNTNNLQNHQTCHLPLNNNPKRLNQLLLYHNKTLLQQ